MNQAELEALDAFLSSERAPEESMLLSDLDGFLTGIAVGPEPISREEWWPVIWGGEEPAFADDAEATAIIGAIMTRYEEILRQIESANLDPIFWSDPDDTIIASDWAVGFMHAVGLRVDAWEQLLKSKSDEHLLFPIIILCGDENGESLLEIPPEDREQAKEEALAFLPDCVAEIAAYWRRLRAN